MQSSSAWPRAVEKVGVMARGSDDSQEHLDSSYQGILVAKSGFSERTAHGGCCANPPVNALIGAGLVGAAAA